MPKWFWCSIISQSAVAGTWRSKHPSTHVAEKSVLNTI